MTEAQLEHELRTQLRNSQMRCDRLERIAREVNTFAYGQQRRGDMERLRFALNAAGYTVPGAGDDGDE